MLGSGKYADTLLADFMQHDNLQEVTLTNQATNAVVTPNIDAINKSLTWKQLAAAGALGIEATDQSWMLGCLSLGDVVPQRGDTITTADGTKWTIVMVVQKSMGDTPVTYECVGRKQI
jgi:hypothetical protein